MPSVGAIFLHPIKGLAPVRVREARVLESGSLENDRRWAFVDRRGAFVNGKNYASLHTIRAEFDLPKLEVTLDGRTYALEHQQPQMAHWVSERLNEKVELRENRELGFPDDTKASGPTFVAESSLRQVSEWFGLEFEPTRRRFRTNVEFLGCEPFWEDRLYGNQFLVGGVRVLATNACKRCVVPSRDALTGEVLRGFQREFMKRREESLPPEAQRTYFDTLYRFAVNTRIGPSECGKTVREGALVSLAPADTGT